MRRSVIGLLLLVCVPLYSLEPYLSTAQMMQQSRLIVHARLRSVIPHAENPYLLDLQFETIELFRGQMPSVFTVILFTGARQNTAGFPLKEQSELLLFLNPHLASQGAAYELVSVGLGWNPVVLAEEGPVLLRPVTGIPALEGRTIRLEEFRAALPR